MDMHQAEIINKAESYLAVRFPDFDKKGKHPVVEDDGDTWKFYYDLGVGMIGGTPVVIIDKKTKEIIKIYRTQ